MHDVLERFLVALGAIAEEDDSSRRRIAIDVYSGRMWTTSQSPAVPRFGAQKEIDHAERGDVHEAGFDADSLADALVFADRLSARDDDDEFVAVGARARRPCT